jgi:hypothetical protein
MGIGSTKARVLRSWPEGAIVKRKSFLINDRMVGTGRFELPTPRTPSEDAGELTPGKRSVSLSDGL